MADVEGAETKVRARRARKAAATTVPRVPVRSPDPIEIAMSGSADHGDDGPSRQLLEKQSRLIDAQLVELKLKRLFWLSVALLAAMLVAGVLYAMAAASQSRAFVMEPLRTPPALAQRGIDGTVLASRIVDELRSLEANTSSVRAPSSYSSSWEDDVNIVIPQAGVSLGEAWDYLRAWLGNDTRVQGEAFAAEGGIGIPVRTSTMPGRTFTGPVSELDRLVREAALVLYRDTQPYRYGVYMSQQEGGSAEEVAAFRLLVERGGREAAWGYRGWGLWHVQRNEDRQALARYRAADAITPNSPAVIGVIGESLYTLGHHEGALAAYRRTIELFDRGATDSLTPTGVSYMRLYAQANIRALTGDLAGAASLAAQSRSNLFGNTVADSLIGEAEFHSRMHDTARAGILLQQARPNLRSSTYGSVFAPFHEGVAALALERENPRAAIAALEQATAVRRGEANPRETVRIEIFPDLARAYALAGDPARAEAVAAQMPSDCYPCLTARGEVAAMRRDWRAAERWYGEAIRQGPSIPYAYSLYGQMLLARGNIDGAIAQFGEAHRRGPRSADPLKYWGDALAARGDVAGSVERYRAAAERAPRWPALHIDLGRALWRLRGHAEARAHFRTAAGLELAPVDRVRLQRILANISGRS